MAKEALDSGGIAAVAARFGEIERLQQEVRQHLDAIREIYGRIARAAGGDGAAGIGAKAGGRPMGARKRAPRGALKEAIGKVLAGGKALTPAEVAAALTKAGYQGSPDAKIFYNTVYLALKNNKSLERDKDGKYELKASVQPKAK